jgi:hypothetical protein
LINSNFLRLLSTYVHLNHSQTQRHFVRTIIVHLSRVVLETTY